MNFPENYAETPEGLVFIADGMSPMSRWDGVGTAIYPVGVTAPATAPSLAGDNAATGTITGDYYAYVRFLNERGAWSDLSPISAKVTMNKVTTVAYTNVATPTQANVVRRQILRNTSGQALTFYVDVDTTDLATTSFTSTNTDDQLKGQIAVPLFDENQFPVANANGVPPAHKCVLAHHSGRMFAAVDRTYSRGNVRLTHNSTTVLGIDTDWTASMAGRYLYVVGATQSYQISSVDQNAQVITLASAYQGASDNFGVYSIRPAPAERRLVYYTQAGFVESWPAFSAISLQEDGDEITGLMVTSSFLYILERQHIYRFTFQADPGTDGFVYLSGTRGCVNNRCWAIGEEAAYMLDYAGVHAFSGGTSEPISDPVQHFFRYDLEGPTINWLASDLFHCAIAPDEQTCRWFVALDGEYLPRHALCFHYREKRWWLEEFDRPIASSVTGTFGGRRRVFLGSRAGQTYLYGQGTLDGLDPTSGTTRGTATSGDVWGLADATATWPDASLLVGQSVAIVSGKGAGQRRQVVGVDATGRLKVKTPFLVAPDASSVYQLGGAAWRWKSGWLRYVSSEEDVSRRFEVLYDPTASPSTLAARIYRDFSATPVVFNRAASARTSDGFSTAAGSPDLLADMSNTSGFVQQRMEGHKELNMAGPRWMSLELAGVTSADVQNVFQVSIDGVQS